MATKPGQFLSGKRTIVAGGGIAEAAFIAALNQLWDPSLKRPEITIFERKNRETSIQQDPYMLTFNGGNQDEGLVALQQLGLLDDIRAHSTLNSGAIRVWSDNWKELASINPKPYGDLPAAAMRISRQDLKFHSGGEGRENKRDMAMGMYVQGSRTAFKWADPSHHLRRRSKDNIDARLRPAHRRRRHQ